MAQGASSQLASPQRHVGLLVCPHPNARPHACQPLHLHLHVPASIHGPACLTLSLQPRKHPWSSLHASCVTRAPACMTRASLGDLSPVANSSLAPCTPSSTYSHPRAKQLVLYLHCAPRLDALTTHVILNRPPMVVPARNLSPHQPSRCAQLPSLTPTAASSLFTLLSPSYTQASRQPA